MGFYAFYVVAIVVLVLHFTGWLARNNLEWVVLVLARRDVSGRHLPQVAPRGSPVLLEALAPAWLRQAPWRA